MYVVRHVMYRYSCHILVKLQFYRQISEKYIDFMEICQTVAKCSMRTDRHDEANSHFSQLREQA
jgi:hypothetical protein